MSPKNPLQNVGLAALGWLGFAVSYAMGADPAPPGQAVAVAPSPSPTVLSLYDGKVYQGTVQVDETGYSVVQNGGVLRFRKELVEGAFGSIREVYRFKAERVPARDPDERLKLARWCLSHRLNAEAKAQLLAVLELSPGNIEIKNMVANIDNAAARTALHDEALVRTRLAPASDGRPGELDPAIFRADRAPVGAAATGLPTIFDLPTPMAVKRADEFTKNVHGILQQACARCHNENYQGAFQLIEVKSRHGLTPNVVRANLEATLRVVDPDSPARSELLTRALVPHGPHKRPIFRGATDPNYQRVAAWVNRLGRSSAAPSSASGRFGPEEPAPSSAVAEVDSVGFAAGRAHPASAPAPIAPDPSFDGRPQPPAAPNPVVPRPPGQFIAGSGSGMQPYAPPDTDFTVPYMMGGPRPKPAATPGQAQTQAQTPATATAGVELPPLPAPGPSAPPTAAASPAATAAPTAAPPTAGAAPKPARQPIKIDPALLERALMNRYTTPQ